MDTAECLKRVRERNPLVHHITNYVTVNDCANACLAVGGSPVMADALEEAADMSGISDALVLNIGTLNADKVKAMILAGKAANKKGIPVIFDPVGCGATSFRNRMAEELLKQVHMAVIRGNVSEIQSLAGKDSQTKGVDAGTTSGLDEAAATAKALALREKCIVIISGAKDIITDGNTTILITNGCPEMAQITGSGCMCTTVVGTFCAACSENLFDASKAAMMAMGISGEKAWAAYGVQGLGHFHMGLIDYLGKIDEEMIAKDGHFENG